MNTSEVMHAAGTLFVSAAGAVAGTAGAAMHAGDSKTAIPLLFVAGVCGMVGANFFRSQETEKAVFDFSLLAAAFIAGASVGPALGVFFFGLIPNVDESYIADFGPHMLGGLIAGGCLVLFFRVLWSRLRHKGKGGKQ